MKYKKNQLFRNIESRFIKLEALPNRNIKLEDARPVLLSCWKSCPIEIQEHEDAAAIKLEAGATMLLEDLPYRNTIA